MTDKVDSRLKRKSRWSLILRIGLALVGLFGCYRFSVGAAKVGISRLWLTLAIVQSRVEPADRAVRLTPKDPEAHYTRALELVNLQRLDEAVAELKQATQLRPYHYYQWLDLGVTLDRLGNQADADRALRESIRLAPNFAQPHWQLGSFLYRQGRYQEAFEEMRLGAKTDPALVEEMLNLGWVAASGDVGRFEALIQPETGKPHLELARFLAKQGKGPESARQVREAGQPRDEEERRLVHETISTLLGLGSFSEALDVWSLSHPSSGVGKGKVLNPDFVDPILADDPGFGWQLGVAPNVLVSIDPAGPTQRTRSLRIEYSGETSTTSPVIDQLVLLGSKGHYSLSFMARTEKLVSGGPPVVVVSEAGGKSPRTLDQSNALSSGSADWTVYTVDFSTEETSSNIVISLQRLPCNQSPCPVFGKLWLSGFTIRKI
jgi:Tfp pilus assembly protein PilF